jgi:ribosome-associated heat shock protein Hsp15
MEGEDTGWQRLDKFLFFARLAKTRALAATLISAGAARINRQLVEKPHARLRPGDVLTLALPRGVLVIEILGLAPRRESAPKAQALHKEIK